MSEELKAYLPVSHELHPVGTRLLVMMRDQWLDNHDDDHPVYEVTVQEWSPGGIVKLRFAGSDDGDGYGSWHRPWGVEVVEELPKETCLMGIVPQGTGCKP